ncbi:MAG: DNA polymerase I [Gemmatimonadales bacterium]|nr:MAG: DNA polymerase I [Gemmatimonadales bacterium]
MQIPPKTAPRLFLIDGYALIYRSFFAFINRPLINSRGENTSAPWGFVNFLLRIRDQYEPDYLAVVFDSGMSQREELYPEYKATREKMPDELAASLPRIRELVEAFRDPVVELEGYEADDVIGTLARKAREAGVEAVVVSGDKDFHQLVGEGVHLLNPGRGGANGVAAEWVDERNAAERLGVAPSQVVDYLALIGDSSDNVPGAPGIGPKTAVKLLDQYGSLDAILERRDEIRGKRARTALQEHDEQILLSRRLVTIMDDLPVELDLESWRVQEPDVERLRDLLVKLEFRTLLERFAGDGEAPEAPGGGQAEYRAVTDPGEVADLVARIREAGMVAVDTETTSLEPVRADLVGISLSWAPGQGVYLPLGHVSPAPSLLQESEAGPPPNLPGLDDPVMAPLVELLQDPAFPKVGQNLKYDLLVFRRAGVELAGVDFDTMVASYVLDPGRRQHSLDALALDLLGHATISYEDVAGKGRKQVPFAQVPLARAVEYACEDADLTLRLRDRFLPDLREQGLEELFRSLEMPLVPVLADMEWAGIRIDPAFFHEMSARLGRELELLQEEIWKEAREEFNINSHPQLREILFEKLGLPVLKRTKTGPSTDASVLEELAAEGHTLPRHLLEYRQLEKLRSTYVDALPRLVNPGTGRIHASFNQTVAATGRLSSSDPNLQNIPIRTPLGREVRKGFVAEDGSVFLAADYSQIELRILAHYSGDEAFVSAFREGLDVHRQTAAVIFEVPVDKVTGEQRARAKTINFATLYGQGDFSLGRQLGISREEARAFIDAYFERFQGVRRFLDEQVEAARERGYVETLGGRRRYIPELESRNWNVRQFGERIAQNTPIQGTAADLIKEAMLEIHRGLPEAGFSARLLLQVHDELVFEVPEGEVEGVQAFVVERMESAMELAVPLRVDVGIGRRWYDCKG